MWNPYFWSRKLVPVLAERIQARLKLSLFALKVWSDSRVWEAWLWNGECDQSKWRMSQWSCALRKRRKSQRVEEGVLAAWWLRLRISEDQGLWKNNRLARRWDNQSFGSQTKSHWCPLQCAWPKDIGGLYRLLKVHCQLDQNGLGLRLIHTQRHSSLLTSQKAWESEGRWLSKRRWDETLRNC